MSRVSIRFFDDREVRAVWDEEQAKWWFSVVDIVGVLNEEDDHTKAGNHWRWLKRKLLKENVQFVSGTHRLKLTASDGKKYLTGTLDSDGITALVKHFPKDKATRFLDRFLSARTAWTGKAGRRHTRSLKADSSSALRWAPPKVCSRSTPTSSVASTRSRVR